MSTQATVPTSIPIPTLAGVTITNSRAILSPSTKLAMMIWAPSGYGKTAFAGSLDALTQKYEGKRTLYIALEAGEGGGTATIRKLGVPIHVPKDYSELFKTLGYLRNDKTIGGIVVDSATEMYKQLIKPATLKYPSRENSPTRAAGVLTRSDYMVSGELTSQIFRALMLLTTHENPEYRKHLIVTAADMTKEEDERVVWVGPDLPGRMSREAVQLFQQVGTINLKAQQVNGKRELVRSLTFTGDGIKALKDRYDVFPSDLPLRRDPSFPGEDLVTIYEKHWVPNLNG